MSKLHEVQVTGDKVEVVEWVGEPPHEDAHITDHLAFDRDCKAATRYATIESDRDYWLAKQGGLFGEDEFEVKELTGSFTELKQLTAIPRKEDDVWSEMMSRFDKLSTSSEGITDKMVYEELKKEFHLTRKNK